MLNMSQDVGELSRTFLAKVQGKAATCEFKTRCKEACCQAGGKSVDFTSTIVKYVLVNGLADAEIRREVLGWKSLDESSLADTVAFIEQKEMARDAFKGEAAGVKTGYRKQQMTGSPSDEAKLRKRVKCEDCDTQISQFVRTRSGKLFEHKFCKLCWQKKHKQKKEVKGSKVETKASDREEKVTVDEASTLFVSSNFIGTGAENATEDRMIPPTNANKNVRRIVKSRRSRDRVHKISVAGIEDIEVAYIKHEAAIVLDHHIFDSTAGWVRRSAWKQPTLRLTSRPCIEMYSKLKSTIPTVVSTVIDGIADTGAQVCLWSLSDFYKAGYKKKELIKVKQKIAAANREPIEIVGAVFLSVESNSFKTNLMAFVTPDINGFYLSRQVLTELYVIPKSFPTAGDAKPGTNVKEEVHDVSAVIDNPSCGCLPRQPPPERPAKIPFPCNIENIPKMRKWLLDTFASSTFNKCPHQPLPFIKANPITLHVDENANPIAHHTPSVLPIHWRDKVKAGLDDDEKLGVIERVPDGVPTTWLHRMVVVPKPSGEPRRTVDLSPLNKYCKRETHATVPPFKQARLVPANTWKTVTDAWSGYHSALIREEDRHYTTFITEWGRYRYRVAPQGYVSSNDGYSKRYDRIIESVERKTKVTDDTVMWDSDQELENHWWRVYDYLALVGKNGIVLNGDKFQFCEKVVDFAGFRISEQKVEPLPKYLKAIETFPTPKNISDVRSWFGLVNQVAHYAQLREMVAPLKPLLSSKSQFYWTNELEESFRNSKQAIIEAIKNGVEIFEPERPTKLHTDYSKQGLGFYLAQKHCSCAELDPSCCENGWRITLSGSRFLKPPETRYVPIEGECLGVAWALEQTRYFTLGCPTLLVVVDHKPLVKVLYDKAMEDITNSRMFKLKERTLPWKFSIIYRPGKLNYFADGTSRNPVEPDDDETDVECETELVSEVSAMFQVKLQPLTSITFELVKSASKDDKIIQQVIMQLISGFPEDKSQVKDEIKQFWKYRDMLSIVDGVLLCDGAVVIPSKLRQAVLDILGSAHQGVQAMKDRAANTIFWPGIHDDISKFKKSCRTCQVIAPSQPYKKYFEPDIPSMPFESIAIDYFDYAGTHYLVVVDRLSNWIEVMKTPPASVYSGSKGLIMLLRELFARFGVPARLSSDGGPEMVAKETQDFFKRWGVSHRLSSAYFSSSNGRAEVCVKATKRMLHDNIKKDGSLDTDRFAAALMTKRNTPDYDSKLSPAEIVMGKRLRDALPMIPKTLMVMNNPAVNPVWRDLWSKKEAVIQDRYLKSIEDPPTEGSRLQPLKENDKVLIQNQTGKSPLRWEKTGTVVEILPYDQYIVKVSGSNRLTRRNRRFLRAYVPAATQERMIIPIEQGGEEGPDVESAWGARDHMLPSSDSTSLQHITPPTASSQMLPATAQEGLPPDANDYSLPNGQTTAPSQTQDVELRRSSRSTRGRTTRFKDCVTGEDLEAL